MKRRGGRAKAQAGGAAHGFTLPELLVYVAITSFVLLITVALGIDLLRGRAKATTLELINQNARLALERLEGAIRNADRINVETSSFGTAAGRLSLQMPEAAVNPTVFDLDAGALRLTEGTGTALPLTDPAVEVAEFTLTHLNQPGAEGVRLSLVLRHRNPQGVAEFSVERRYNAAAIVR